MTEELRLLTIMQIYLELKKPHVLRTKQKEGLDDKEWHFSSICLALYK